MAEVLDTLRRRLDGGTIRNLSRRVGSDESTVRRVAAMAVPMLVAGLARNVDSGPESRASLDRALREDHDGSLLDHLGSLLGDGYGRASGGGPGGIAGAVGGLLDGGGSDEPRQRRATDGDGILRHLLGDRRDVLESGAARASGMDRSQVGTLLSTLAPLVMSALGRVKRERDLSADGVAELVERERHELEANAPDAGEGAMRRVVEASDEEEAATLVDRLGSALDGSFLGGSGPGG